MNTESLSVVLFILFISGVIYMVAWTIGGFHRRNDLFVDADHFRSVFGRYFRHQVVEMSDYRQFDTADADVINKTDFFRVTPGVFNTLTTNIIYKDRATETVYRVLYQTRLTIESLMTPHGRSYGAQVVRTEYNPTDEIHLVHA